MRDLQQAFLSQKRRLWGICYRMTGCAADADDLLQETFARALDHPPEGALEPWLTRVAMNLCRDHLRRRAVRGYRGPWLPGPLETGELELALEPEISPEARYSRRESVSLAFLRMLEALSPNQRAVLVLRDVLGFSVEETAEVLEVSEAVVKTTLHRAREKLESPPQRVTHPVEQQAAVLQAFLGHLASNNVEALRSLLAENVVTLNDGAGERLAAQRPVVGREKVLLFHQRTRTGAQGICLCELNGVPAVMVSGLKGRNRRPERAAMWVELDQEGRISEIHWLIAERKLLRLPWQRSGRPGPSFVFSLLSSTLSNPPVRQWFFSYLRRGWQRLWRRWS